MLLNNTTSLTDHEHPLQLVYQLADQLYSANTEPDVSAIQTLATQLQHLGQHHTNLLFSQLSLTPTQPSQLAQLAVKQAAVLALLQISLRLPQSYHLQLLYAVLVKPLALASNTAFTEVQQRFPALLTLKRYPTLCRELALSAVFKLCYRKNRGLTAWQSSLTATLVSFCWQVARLMLVGTGRFAALEQISVGLLSQSDEVELACWQAISRLTDCPWLTGRYVKTAEQQLLMLLSGRVNDSGMYLAQAFAADGISVIHQLEVHPAEVQLLHPRSFKDWQLCQHWLDTPEKYIHEDKLPGLDWIQQLSQTSSVSRQVRQLAQQPALTALLLRQATQLSRQQLAPASVQHALALIGQHNLPALLQQCWLEHHCQQQVHPWHQQLLQFRQLLQQAILLLDQHYPLLGVNQVTASTLAWCFCWPLWQQNEPRLYPLSNQRGQSYFAQFLQHHIWQQQHYQQLLHKVMTHLQCPALWLKLANHFRTADQITGLLMTAALQLSSHVFVATATSAKQVSASLTRLAMSTTASAASTEEYLEPLISFCHPHSLLYPLCNLISALPDEMPLNSQISVQINA